VIRPTKPSEGTAHAARPEGLAGLRIDDFVVRGIIEKAGERSALIATSDGRTYTIRSGDRLFDGTVRAVTSQSVVLIQAITDPLSLEKQREVIKYLRSPSSK
jgi:Tfp pilus assembly protein PilP